MQKVTALDLPERVDPFLVPEWVPGLGRPRQ